MNEGAPHGARVSLSSVLSLVRLRRQAPAHCTCMSIVVTITRLYIV